MSGKSSLSSQVAGGLQGWPHKLGVVFLVYLRHGPAPIRPSSLLGPQLGELLEGALQAPRYVGSEHFAGLTAHNLGGMDRPPRDEDERPGQRPDLTFADQEEKLSLEDVEQFVVTVVNMARWPGPRGSVASRNPIEPPVSSPVAFSVMASVPGIFRPSPGPRMMPPEAVPCSPRPSDPPTGSSPLPSRYPATSILSTV